MTRRLPNPHRLNNEIGNILTELDFDASCAIFDSTVDQITRLILYLDELSRNPPSDATDPPDAVDATSLLP